MNNLESSWEEIKWKVMKRQLRLSDEKMKLFQNNPKNEKIVSRIPEILEKVIIAEVIDSQGCNSKHRKGDQLIFDAAGNLLTEYSPKKICIFALHAITMQIFAVGEMLTAGINPNEMRFNRAACFDVGVECGGWGKIILEIKVTEKDEFLKGQGIE